MVSGYPTSTNSPWVDGLSTDPRDLGCHGFDLGTDVTTRKLRFSNKYLTWEKKFVTKYIYYQQNLEIVPILVQCSSFRDENVNFVAKHIGKKNVL